MTITAKKPIVTEWPDFTLHMGARITQAGGVVVLGLYYKGELREREIPVEEFCEMLSIDQLRKFKWTT